MESDHVTLYSSDTRHSQMNEENEKGMGVLISPKWEQNLLPILINHYKLERTGLDLCRWFPRKWFKKNWPVTSCLQEGKILKPKTPQTNDWKHKGTNRISSFTFPFYSTPSAGRRRGSEASAATARLDLLLCWNPKHFVYARLTIHFSLFLLLHSSATVGINRHVISWLISI